MEVWRPVVGFEGLYEVSDQGRVRSLDRVITRVNRWGSLTTYTQAGRVLSPMVNRKRGGYRYVNLQVPGKQTLRRVAVLVAAAFLGPRPAGHEVAHGNGNPIDDALTNLRYATPKENSADRRKHGTHLCGDTHPSSRLKTVDVLEIRASSASRHDLAAKFGVDARHIDSVRSGRRWAHV